MLDWLFDGVGWVRDLTEPATRPFTDIGEYIIRTAVDWGIDTAKDQAFDRTEEFKDHVKELTLKYYDSLVEGRGGHLRSPFGGVADGYRKFHYILMGTTIAAGFGTEYFIYRRKDYSWTRGLMWAAVLYSAVVASSQMTGVQFALDKLPLDKIDIDTDELRRTLEEFLNNAAFATSFPDL